MRRPGASSHSLDAKKGTHCKVLCLLLSSPSTLGPLRHLGAHVVGSMGPADPAPRTRRLTWSTVPFPCVACLPPGQTWASSFAALPVLLFERSAGSTTRLAEDTLESLA